VGFGNQPGKMAGSIKQAILGVDMKVNKVFFHKEISLFVNYSTSSDRRQGLKSWGF
jgi:hypothetical protein